MTDLVPQIDAHEFRLKLIGLAVAAVALLLYLLVSYLRAGSFLGSGEADEEDRLGKKLTTIDKLQAGTWNVNLSKATTFASVCVSTVTLAAVFIFQQRLTSYDAIFWNIVLITATIATFCYFISIQMWFMAHDNGGSPDIQLRYRRQATWSQNTGWMFLVLVVILVMTAINTFAGWCAMAVGLPSMIYSLEYKARLSRCERWSAATGVDLDHLSRLSTRERWAAATLNDFQAKLDLESIYVKNGGDHALPATHTAERLRIVSWNIGRGYVTGMIAAYLNELEPDIVCLQEVDWMNRRTKGRDVLDEIARRTGMAGYYAVEFLEIDTPYRGTALAGGGACGNAILTRIPLQCCYRVELPTEFDWGDWRSHTARRQKRVGARCALVAEFGEANRKLTVVCAHLENMWPCGVSGRHRQFGELLKNVRGWADPGEEVVICGDLNTLENWLTDPGGLRGRGTGMGKRWYEAEWSWWKRRAEEEFGLRDPFGSHDWTVKHTPLYRAKLDWILLRNCRAAGHGRGEWNTSDHRPLWADIDCESSKGQSS